MATYRLCVSLVLVREESENVVKVKEDPQMEREKLESGAIDYLDEVTYLNS